MMGPWETGAAIAMGAAGCLAAAGAWSFRRRGLHRWVFQNLFRQPTSHPIPGQPIHVLLAICDHFEPKRGGAQPPKAKARVQQWLDEYPRLFDRFRDCDGRPPQYSFFYPEDEYEPEYVDMLAGLCRKGYGEVEIHLHHDNDSEENLRQTLLGFKTKLAERHGLLSRDKETGEISYGFIHGNWSLDNSRSDGRWCGVNNELDILRETGCYADFTLPSAPSETQTGKINSIYWAVDDPTRPKSHNSGVNLGVGPRPDNSLLMIQGPLLLDWKKRKFGIMPKIENSCLQVSQPPSKSRFNVWLRASVTIPTKPNWVFVKLHTHGVNEPNQDVLLGQPMEQFHEMLQERANGDSLFRFHYVTAREMANIALVAEQELELEIAAARSFRYEAIG